MSIEKRYERVREEARSQLEPPILAEIAAVVCNGCGATVQAETLDDLLEKAHGWRLSSQWGGDDFCPWCGR